MTQIVFDEVLLFFKLTVLLFATNLPVVKYYFHMYVLYKD